MEAASGDKNTATVTTAKVEPAAGCRGRAYSRSFVYIYLVLYFVR